MSNRPEIPQDLAQTMVHLILSRSITCRSKDWLQGELDAMEQPPDPAEVAAETYVEHTFSLTPRTELAACGLTPISCIREHLPAIERQAHAPQRKAVKVLSDWLANFEGETGQTHKLNTRVRKLFRFDKEKP